MSNNKHFRILDGNSEEQKAIFETLNEVIDLLGSDAKELDTYFRASLMDVIMLSANATSYTVLRDAPDTIQKQLYRAIKQAKAMYKGLAKQFKSIDPELLPKFIFNPPLTHEELGAAFNHVTTTRSTFASGLAEHLELQIGRFQDINADTDNEYVKSIHETFNKGWNLKEGVLSQHNAPSGNILQKCAAGKPLITGSNRRIQQLITTNVTAESPNFEALIASALFNAIAHIQKDKNLQKQRGINNKLNKCFDQLSASIQSSSLKASSRRDQRTSLNKQAFESTQLQGGTELQRRLFKQAIEALPTYLVQELIHQKLTFILDENGRNHSEGNAVTLGQGCLQEKNPAGLKNNFTAHLTANIFSHTISVDDVNDQYQKALDEHLDRLMMLQHPNIDPVDGETLRINYSNQYRQGNQQYTMHDVIQYYILDQSGIYTGGEEFLAANHERETLFEGLQNIIEQRQQNRRGGGGKSSGGSKPYKSYRPDHLEQTLLQPLNDISIDSINSNHHRDWALRMGS